MKRSTSVSRVSAPLRSARLRQFQLTLIVLAFGVLDQECGAAARGRSASSRCRARRLPSSAPRRIRALVQKLFRGLFVLCGSTSTKSASTPTGLNPPLPVSAAREQPLHRFGRVAAMRYDFFERILARLDARVFACRSRSSACRFSCSRVRLFVQLLLRRLPLLGHRLQLQLAAPRGRSES